MCRSDHLLVLPCSLSKEQEEAGLALAPPVARDGIPLRVLFIGRLDSYKRLDWLIRALAHLTSPWRLAVVGDGPKRKDFEQLAHQFPADFTVTFHGACRRPPNFSNLLHQMFWYCLQIAAMRLSASFS